MLGGWGSLCLIFFMVATYGYLRRFFFNDGGVRKYLSESVVLLWRNFGVGCTFYLKALCC